jgi:hypothetical protein
VFFEWSPHTSDDSAKLFSMLLEPNPFSIDVRKAGFVPDLCIEAAIGICIGDNVFEPVCGIYGVIADPVKSPSAT